MAEIVLSTNIEISMPAPRSAQSETIRSVIKVVLSTFLKDSELSWLIAVMSLGQKDLMFYDYDGKALRERIDNFVETWYEQGLLVQAISYIQQLRPGIWREQILPLVRPRFYIPMGSEEFLGRHEECVEIVDALLESPSNLVIISGVNGVGKTALALEIARLCKKHGHFEDILWISVKSGKLLWMDEASNWSKWLRDLNLTLGWGINIPVNTEKGWYEFQNQCWERLKAGYYLLCVDGLDEPDEYKELLEFLRGLNDGVCKALVTTTCYLSIKDRLDIPLGGWDTRDAALWLYRAGLHWNIPHLKYADDEEIKKLRDNTGGIPLALIWAVAHKSVESTSSDPYLQTYKGIPPEQLLSTIFASSFEHLSKQSQQLLLALSIFDLPATRLALVHTAGIADADFGLHVSELKELRLIEHDDQRDRYSLLSITRTFAEQQLAQQYELAKRLRWSWVEYYQKFSVLYAGKSRRKYAFIADDWENLWQAVQYVIGQWKQATQIFPLEHEGREWGYTLISFANALTDFCRVRGYWDERFVLCQTAAEAADTLDLPEHLGRLAYTVGWMLCSRGKLEDARYWGKWALDRLEKLGQGKGYALRLLARIERDAAGPDLGKDHQSLGVIEKYLEEATIAFERDEDEDGLGRVEADRGNIAFRCKEYARAINHHTNALEYSNSVDDVEVIAISMVNLGDTYLEMKLFEKARLHYQEALNVAGPSDIVEVVADAERGLAKAFMDELPSVSATVRTLYLQRSRQLTWSAHNTFVRLGVRSQITKVEDLQSRIEQAFSETVSSTSYQEDRMDQTKQPINETSPEEKYVDFDLHIGPDGHAVANSSIAGQATAKIPLDVPNAIELALSLIEARQTNTKLLKQVGQAFYDWLFPSPIHTHFHQTEAVARRENSKMRLRLRIEAEEIASLPLEFTYRAIGDYFLAVNPDTVFSRYLNLPLPPERVRRREGALHMLAIIADPTDQTRLPPDEWEAIIREALAEPLANGQMKLQPVKRATRKEIRDALLQQKPDIIQFVGHGIYKDGRGYLALVDDQTGKTWLVDDERFANLYLGHDDHLGLICLATCESAKSDDPQGFLGIAPQLVQRGIPAVVAMQYKIYIDTAKVFLEDFYTSVAAHKSIDWAVQSARNAISQEFGLGNREFATPVLYMRAQDGNIF